MAPILFAHRGGWNPHPDNSIASFRAAAELGAKAFETDVRLSRDGVPILQHDGWLWRRFRFRLVSWASAASLARSDVATVAAFADAFLGGTDPVPVSVDLKQEGAGRRLVEVLMDRAPHALPHIYLAGKNLAELVELRAFNEQVGLVHSSEAKYFDLPLDKHGELLARERINACNVPVEDWSAALVQAVQREGVLVFSSLINQPDRMRTALSYGVDGVHTDDVAAMVKLLKAWDEGAET